MLQRMRILKLRAARGWSSEKTAGVSLVGLQTLMAWMRGLDEPGAGVRPLVQTTEPVNRYPDLGRHLVRALKRPRTAMGNERIADVLVRAGSCLGAPTVRRMTREATPPPEDDPEIAAPSRRRVVANGLFCPSLQPSSTPRP